MTLSYRSQRAYATTTAELIRARDARQDAVRLKLGKRRPLIEHMAVALVQGRVCLATLDAPIIYLATAFADREINFLDVRRAVDRARAIRRDELSHPRAFPRAATAGGISTAPPSVSPAAPLSSTEKAA